MVPPTKNSCDHRGPRPEDRDDMTLFAQLKRRLAFSKTCTSNSTSSKLGVFANVYAAVRPAKPLPTTATLTIRLVMLKEDVMRRKECECGVPRSLQSISARSVQFRVNSLTAARERGRRRRGFPDKKRLTRGCPEFPRPLTKGQGQVVRAE
ncbi:hypothetical protein BDY19DRAFT_83256 [Irpex rosettiformis]|uniref:Uncharacterized protein n=1 Tax=Irpex rosettiformis TaxID=378272 RepID=A0ACB8U6B8_9APHY|nr:hypothetical protein BDY19DRAFT_83256 [Irpex rosettiformis]